jgi:hypothetical protein
MVCGASRIADELLKRMGENWEGALIDNNEEQGTRKSHAFEGFERISG